MFVHVLGAAAGGGFPQWNCNCPNCYGLRNNTIKATARTQSSIAVSANGEDWVLYNASPDILSQLAAFPALQPSRTVRDTGIRAVILMDSQIDHTAGLLMLREGCPHQVYCTDPVYQDLTTGFPVFNILEHWNGGLVRHAIPLGEGPSGGESFAIDGIEGLSFTAVAVDGKAPPYSPHRHQAHTGDNIGMRISDLATGRTLFYAPGLGRISDVTWDNLQQANCVMVDGTFWQQDEMAVVGLGNRKAADMGHLPQSGPGGMLEVLRDLPQARRILIHINNTNPILNEESEQRRIVEAQGIEVAWDGMAFEL